MLGVGGMLVGGLKDIQGTPRHSGRPKGALSDKGPGTVSDGHSLGGLGGRLDFNPTSTLTPTNLSAPSTDTMAAIYY